MAASGLCCNLTSEAYSQLTEFILYIARQKSPIISISGLAASKIKLLLYVEHSLGFMLS